MNPIERISSILVMLFLMSCGHNCPDYHCLSLPAEFHHLIIKHSDSLTFRNISGEEIKFNVNSSEIAYHSNTFDDCGGCPPQGLFFSITDDLSRVVKDSLGSQDQIFNSLLVRIGGANIYNYNCDLFGSHCTIQIHPYLPVGDNQEYVQEVSMGGEIYKNVVIHEFDTNSQNPQFHSALPKHFVWKVYANKEFGIVGFYDLQTNSLFYRY